MHYLRETLKVNDSPVYSAGTTGTAANTDSDMDVEEARKRREKRKLAPGSPFMKKKKDQGTNIEQPS